jgi:hypothetical protein
MESVDAVIVAVDPGHLAVAAAEDSALEAHLIEHLWEIPRVQGCGRPISASLSQREAA